MYRPDLTAAADSPQRKATGAHQPLEDHSAGRSGSRCSRAKDNCGGRLEPAGDILEAGFLLKEAGSLVVKSLETFLNAIEQSGVSETIKEGAGQLKSHLLTDDRIEWIRRRLEGDFSVDEWGMDEDIIEFLRPFFLFLYRKYWRVSVSGIENVPSSGRALLVANHSGVLPYDGAMVLTAIQEEHPHPRFVRCLHLSLFSRMPFLNPLMAKLGQVQALPENGERLLNQDQLVCVFPEGVKGIGKLFRDRYRLARFGRGGFASLALKTHSPIIPVSIVGAEEIHPHVKNFKPLASLLKLPYFPLTPTFPFLGPLGLIPMPTKWFIHFDQPISVKDLKFETREEPLLISRISSEVKQVIQANIDRLLDERNGVF